MNHPQPPLTPAPPGVLDSPAARRNAAPILGVLKARLPARGRVLEVASGGGRHAVTFAAALPGLEWIPSDPDAQARDSLERWREAASLTNLKPALALDCLQPAGWPPGPFDAVVCANMIHISPWAAAEGVMRLAGAVVAPLGLLVLYGPFLESETAPAPSNLAFDADLKSRNPAWGLRDRDAVAAEARRHGLALTLRVPMPANNLCLVFRRLD